MQSSSEEPRPSKPEKRGPSSDPEGHAQPEAAEVESARLLANDARDELRKDGLSDEDIERLADEYIALNIGEGTREFIGWAREDASHRR